MLLQTMHSRGLKLHWAPLVPSTSKICSWSSLAGALCNSRSETAKKVNERKEIFIIEDEPENLSGVYSVPDNFQSQKAMKNFEGSKGVALTQSS